METKGKVLMQKYEFGRLLGQGNFAKVYYARNIETSQSVAIKVIEKEKALKAGMIDQTKREISVMGLVKHPNVLELYEVIASKSKIYFVMEYAKGGELFNKVSKGKLREDVARKYFQQLISAVDFCHSRDSPCLTHGYPIIVYITDNTDNGCEHVVEKFGASSNISLSLLIEPLSTCLFVSFRLYPDKTRECRKMCLHAVNSLSEAHKVVSSSELPLFILNEVGYSTHSRFMFCVQILNGVENKISVMLTNDLVEDG
ncbi:hypothetical protein PTKIN_Ptkin01aG0259600 [Pterospermum kingtungense]